MLIFFQVGYCYEFYGKQALKACELLKLNLIEEKHHFKMRCGIGVRALDRYVDLALRQGISVVVIQQTGAMSAHVAERRVTVQYRHRKT